MAPSETIPMSGAEWMTANAQYLAIEMDRLRLLLRRRLLWLRGNWQREASARPVSWAITDQEVDLLLTGTSQRDEFRFYQSDTAAQEVSSAIDQLDRRLYLARQRMEDSGTSAPLDVLAMRFDLNAFERDVVLLCLAPELDPAFERIYAYVQDEVSRRYATSQLALTLFFPQETALSSFSSAAPLRRWNLVHMDTAASQSLLARPLRIDERILQYVCGVNQLDLTAAGLLERCAKTPLPACNRDLASRLALRLNPDARGSSIVNIVGPSDSGRMALAYAACEYGGLGLLVLHPNHLPESACERGRAITSAEREAALLGSGLFLDIDGLKPEEMQALYASLERVNVPLVIASRERLAWERDMLPVRIARPDSVSQAHLWSEVLGESALDLQPDIDAIVEQFDLGPSGIARAAALAANHASLRSPAEPTVTAEDLWQACRQQSGPQIEQLARRVEACYGWDDLVVPPGVLHQLHEIASQVAHRPHVYQGWGFAKKLSRGRGISVLFSGSSGVGKTMAAEVLACHLKLDLYRIDLAGVVSKYIGQTEKNLRSVFDAAERSGAILFFDEADALFGKRTEVKDSHDRFANIEINYLLQRMEDYRGLAILATNMRGTMDQAFLRRLRFIVDFPFPDALHRMEIWRKVFPPQAPLSGIDFAALSRLEIPGGNIRNIAVNAAFLAAAENREIAMDHVMKAARREYAKIDRLILDTEFGRFAGAASS